MSRSIRGILVGITALVAMLAMSANSFAALVLRINESATTGTATAQPVLKLSSGATSTCATSSVRATIANLNQVSIANGGVAFNNCTLGTNSLVVTQLSAWTATLAALLNASNEATGIRTTFIVPTSGVQLAAGPCTFTLGGFRSTLNTFSPAVPLGRLATVSDLVFADDGENGLTVNTVNNALVCGAAGVRVGGTATFVATYRLAPALTGTLVNLP